MNKESTTAPRNHLFDCESTPGSPEEFFHGNVPVLSGALEEAQYDAVASLAEALAGAFRLEDEALRTEMARRILDHLDLAVTTQVVVPGEREAPGRR